MRRQDSMLVNESNLDDPEAAKANGRGHIAKTAEERRTADTQKAATWR